RILPGECRFCHVGLEVWGEGNRCPNGSGDIEQQGWAGASGIGSDAFLQSLCVLETSPPWAPKPIYPAGHPEDRVDVAAGLLRRTPKTRRSSSLVLATGSSRMRFSSSATTLKRPSADSIPLVKASLRAGTICC